MGVLEPLEQIEFLSHPVPSHQFLVHLFDRHRTFGAPVVTAFDDRETTPGGEVREDSVCHSHINMFIMGVFGHLYTIHVTPHKQSVVGFFSHLTNPINLFQ